ncbi:MAG TPA: hypothetical protein VNV35_04005 [Puia sp.]|nr:hypothetical protein [Puia sp.]
MTLQLYNLLMPRLTPLLIALAACLPAAAQESGRDSLQMAFSRYQSQTPQEKLFVHIDRSFYLAGETIWFSLYDIDARSNRPVSFSSIAYIEVLDPDDSAVLQAKVEMNNGRGDGSFSIPLSVPSGKFLFRAYTSWMKNFGPDFYYMQPLTILNTLNDSATDTTPSSRPADTGRARIRLFPEGGNLVGGLSSLIAIEALDRQGEGASCDGAIIDQHNDTVARFHSGPAGIGKFSFIPAAGNSYLAVASIDHEIVTQQLPAGYDQGYVMHLEDDGGPRVRITIHVAGPIQNPIVYFFAHTRGQVEAAQMNYLIDARTTFYLDKDSLGDGISHLTVFNSDRLPVCERLYFKQPNKSLHIGISNLSPNYPARSPVSVGLSAADDSGNPLPADLSMSVFRLDSFQSVPDANIIDWLLLSSDLTTTPTFARVSEAMAWITNAATGSLDDLMLTRGWSRFRWEDILRKPAFEFLPETNGPVILAKVLDKRTGQPAAPLIGYLSLPGRHFKLAAALSQPNGNIYFHLDNLYGSRTLIALTNSLRDSNCRIDLINPWSDRFAPFPLSPVQYHAGWSDQLLQRTIDAQAENAYLTGRKHRLGALATDTVAFYGAADLNFNLDEYVRFITMDEVIREFVDNVRIRLKSGHSYFRVRNALFNLFFDDDPLLLIDGIPVFNADKLVAIDPAKIEKIEVVSHRYVLGPSITDGVVTFRSYDGEFAGYELDPNAVAIQYNGLDRHREFYTPVYDAGNKGIPSIPDFRSELLWAPNIHIDATGKVTLPLYTSDLKGKFALVVQGITKNGMAGYSMVTFSVGQ